MLLIRPIVYVKKKLLRLIVGRSNYLDCFLLNGLCYRPDKGAESKPRFLFVESLKAAQ